MLKSNAVWYRYIMGLLLILSCLDRSYSQATASFTTADTVCINNPVSITNTSTGASSYFWNFCVADINQAPIGTNLGNVGGNLSMPVFMDYVFANNNYYGFSINFNGGGLVRYDFGNSLLNTPTTVNLGNFGGIIPPVNSAEGIQVVQNEGRWYAIIVGGYIGGNSPRILKVDFGPNINNPTPAATDWGNIGNLNQPIDLHVFKEGNNWYGFTVNAENNTITRFNFTNSFNNTPTGTNLGNIGNLAYPTGIYAVNDNGNWRVFITNAGDNTRNSGVFSLTRLDFGNSLLNIPSGINLGSLGGVLKHPRDLTILKSCGQIIGFAVNGHLNDRSLVQLDFNNDLATTPVATSLGNIGNLSFPHSLSKLFRVNEDIYAFITNVDNNTLTRLRFAGCTNASIASSSSITPPPITYNIPGTYNINLTVDDGLPTQTAFCKQVVVLQEPVSAPTKRMTLCSGVAAMRIGTGTGNATYLWNTGATTDSIDVSAPGTYYVDINRFGCTAADTFVVNSSNCIVTASFTAPDTVCINNPIQLTNTSIDASSYFWNFCVADINQAPQGTNLGNPGNRLSMPVFMDYIQQGGNYYGLVVNHVPGGLVRLDFGNSLLNTPVATSLGNFGGIIPANNGAEGIQIVENEGKWYAIIVGGHIPNGSTPRILKLDFGPDITNPTPTPTNWGNLGNMSQPIDLHVFKENNNWYGFTINAENNTITRFDFSNSFDNTPTAINLGNIGNLNYPTGIYAINNSGAWHVFITNGGSGPSSLTRLDFGNSLLNAPTGVNLGNPNGVLDRPRDLTIMKSCGQIVGFAVNGGSGSNSLIKFDFNNDLMATPSATSLGNMGNFNFPHSISKLFRVNEDLYSFVTNVNNNTITRLRFTGCTNASIPNSTDETPPPITYNTPGTYNINLSVDDGLPTQTAYCRQVVVLPEPVSAPTQRLAVCAGVTQRIGTATRSATYVWNTGATTDSIDVSAPGTYWVDIDRFGCKATDTFIIRAAACSNISNIINDYTEVLALEPCNNTLVVGDATAYNVGDTVLLIQMKGAIMDVTNTAAFGNILNYQSAGNYEFNYVKSKTGNTIELLNIVTKSFDVPNGNVQLVRVPYYEDAVITSTLTCLPWDGSKGGIVVLNARNTINLNANIDVSQKGFRGGAAEIKPSDCAETSYFYDQTSNKAALKGEGIVQVNSNMIRGRGKAVNGGGGGNNHNAGGGGGSNAGAGGVGGRETAVAGCAQLNNGGAGGAPLTYTNAQNKIFMGGGGGAGDVNGVTGVAAPGGNGGGIVIVMAPVLYTNSNAILSRGQTPVDCSGGDCWEGQSGGGAGGTVLLSVDNIIGNTTINTSGGNGASLTNLNAGAGYNGTGGGGGGGMLWTKTASLPAGITHTTAGGIKGVFIPTGNDGGAQNGGLGQTAFSLQMPIATTPFKTNIDSVRIKANIVACTPPAFEGLAWTNTRPVNSWLWSFGDGATATTQNATHIYQNPGNYTVKLVVTDANGCKDSISMPFRFDGILDFDFNYKIDACSPLEVQFTGLGSPTTNAYWEFGDNTTATGATQVSHVYAAENTYKVRYSVTDGACTDTITKLIPITVLKENIILTSDTVICDGTTKQLRAVPALSYCWFPATYLDNPAAQNPVTSTPQDITYYLHSESIGNNLIVNGDFSAGNTGFGSDYAFSTGNNTVVGVYGINSNPSAWNSWAAPCADHTGSNGNMIMFDGANIPGQKVWYTTVSITPNTNFAFSSWIQSIHATNPARLQFFINGKLLGNVFSASATTCQWQQFYEVWNSGNATTAEIAIVNQNINPLGNDFALDDISFAAVTVKRDSVVIKVEKPLVVANNDTAVCSNKPVSLFATGADTYTWTPAVGLSNPSISNPIALPVASGVNSYIVTGTTTNGCVAKDTVLINVYPKLDFDFAYQIDVCSPLAVQFTGLGSTTSNPYWDLGDNTMATGITQISHVYTSENTYKIRYSVTDGSCTDTLEKLIPIRVLRENIVLTQDTTICANTTKQLRAASALSYCWFPTTYLDNPAAQNPVTSTPQDITYYLHSESTGNNLIVNGDFSAGNTGFTSQYIYAATNTTEGEYFVGPNPQLWNAGTNSCSDHTGNGNMMLINGNPIADQTVWTQTINVIPNTNYAFSTWIQSIFDVNPAQLQFSINGKDLGGAITASIPACNWQQFYTTWNSGNNTTARISIVNKNTIIMGNDFALDDISFAQVLVKQDSVVIKVDRPLVRTNNDTTVCSDKQVPLLATGAATYSWSPAAGLSNPAIANPVATPAATPTQYIVTGTTTNGCVAKDTVLVSAYPKPVITKTQDTLVCRNSSFPLFATGGVSYAWSSSAGQLSGANSDRPIVSVGASPATYQVAITDSYSCVSLDSVEVTVRPYPVFQATGNVAICAGSSQVMQASGGDVYTWSPALWFNDPASPSTVVTPEATTLFSVYIQENTCGFDTTINMLLTVNPVPALTVNKANDVNCNTPTAQLNVTGAIRYTWSPATGLDNANKANPVAAIDTTTDYRVTGVNQFGCSSNAYIQVKATKDGIPRFVVPNAFTPNGDRKNDCFGIQRWGNAIVQEFTVYNRWGQKVFQANNPNQCWDGTFNGKPQDSGGYVYVIRARTLCGEVTTRGIVMLIR